jgi:predicted enzyme related to lactoylglutathione lyase
MMATHGAFYWNELMTTDPVAAAAFFKGLIGYDVSEMPMPDGDGGTYRVLMKDGKPMGGIMGMAPGLPPGVPPHWTSYLAVDDVDASTANLRKLGGHVIRAPWDVPGVGRIAIVTDPQGAVLGLITPSQG